MIVKFKPKIYKFLIFILLLILVLSCYYLYLIQQKNITTPILNKVKTFNIDKYDRLLQDKNNNTETINAVNDVKQNNNIFNLRQLSPDKNEKQTQTTDRKQVNTSSKKSKINSEQSKADTNSNSISDSIPENPFVVQAISYQNKNTKAVLKSNNSKKTYIISQGSEIENGYRVKKIKNNRVILSYQDHELIAVLQQKGD